MTLVIAWSSFTALQHSCILYRCLLGGMCVHFKFPGLARMLNLYCIVVYSVIDPSGIKILGWSSMLCLACFLAGKVLGTTAFGSLPFSVYISHLFYSTLCGHFTGDDFRGFDIWNRFLRNFCKFLVVFLCWHAGSCRISGVWVQTTSYDMYIYITLVVAGCRWFLCYVCFGVFW